MVVFPDSLQKHVILCSCRRYVVHSWLGYCFLVRWTTFKVFKIGVVFFEGVAIAQNAEEGVIRRKFFVVQFLFTIERFVGQEPFCLVSLLSFEKGVETSGTTEEIHNVK